MTEISDENPIQALDSKLNINKLGVIQYVVNLVFLEKLRDMAIIPTTVENPLAKVMALMLVERG